MAMGVGEEALRAEDSPSGGVDVWSDALSSHAPDHLVVMVHVILGSTADWQYAANEFVKQLPDNVIVHCSEKSMNTLTLDGVDVMGNRLVDERMVEDYGDLYFISALRAFKRRVVYANAD